jgi:HAD superfamily hydrolase (TIGR01549 family)
MGKGLASRYDLFVFDWDGTLNNMGFLVRTNELLKRAFLGSRNYKKEKLTENEIEIKERLAHREFRDTGMMLNLMEVYLMFSKPRLHLDTKRLLKELKEKKKRVALFTNARVFRLVKELEYLSIEKYFDVIISTREIHALKPNPLGLELIVRKLKADKDRTLYIGDMIDDIVAAKSARVHSCAIADGFDSYEKLEELEPEYIFRSIREFLDAL